MRTAFLVLLVLPLIAAAQHEMKFEHGLSWKQIQEKAKVENKFIFVDAFTTWCGPCRYMASTIFPMEKVGDFFNKNFINVTVQLDSTAKDNEEVKSWYADGHDIMKDYKITAFPTYLFFDPNGKIVHRFVGSSDADQFIAKASNALDPAKQYYVLIDQYKAGNKDPDFLRKATKSAIDSYDRQYITEISREYIATQKDLTTNENLLFLDEVTNSSKDPGFDIIMKNKVKYDQLKGNGSANRMIIEIIKSEELYPLFKKQTVSPDWADIKTNISKKYPEYGDEAVSGFKVIFYQSKGDWTAFQSAVLAYMKDYGSTVSPAELNEFAWTVFLNCKDMTCVKEALDWSRRSFKDKEDPMFIDTYANIIYKLGKKDEAIKWEEKALVLSNNEKSYQETLEKMKKGEKTWKE